MNNVMEYVEFVGSLSEEIIVCRQYVNPGSRPFNTRVNIPGDAVVIVRDGLSCKKLGGVRGDYLNENRELLNQKKGLFRRNKVEYDPKGYELIYVYTGMFQGNSGTSVQYLDEATGGVQETICVRCRYKLRIDDAMTFINSGLCSGASDCRSKDIARAVHESFEGAIKEKFKIKIDANGAIDTQKHLTDISEMLESQLNERLTQYGISASDFNLTYEEAESHVEIRNGVAKEKYLARSANELEEIFSAPYQTK